MNCSSLSLYTVDCPQEKLNNDDFCYVMKGQMSLMSHASDNLSEAMNDIRAGIKEAMDNDALLDPSDPALSAITRVVYLGESENDIVAFGIPNGAKGIDSGDDSSGIFVPILAAALVGTALIALLLLLLRRRRRLVTQRQLDTGAAVLAASSDASSSIGDPTGTFHQGYYHYTKDGVRYLSQYCATCRETERQLAMGHGLETISEDAQFFEGRNRLIAANSKDLGGIHSTIDVHNCTSATCHCREREGDVTFAAVPMKRAARSDVTDIISNTTSSKSSEESEAQSTKDTKSMEV